MEDPEAGTVSGGGAGAIDAPNPVREAALRLELLSPETREAILAKMPSQIAEKVRDYLASLPDRPHGQFSTDIATRRQLIHQTANGVAARRTAEVDQQVSDIGAGAPAPMPMPSQPGMPAAQPPAPESTDPLDRLRELHPAAIARAMQGERAEAWAIVLDRLDVNARAALQLYLDASARAAIEDAKARQSELAASSPALLRTVEAAIARTVVPRAMREHHQLLSTTPLAWTGMPA
jgi:flagellar motor switch protein FliG